MIAVLALQGAFAEHQQMLSLLGEESILIRNLTDWLSFMADSPFRKGDGRGLIIPGGESTAMMRIIKDLHLYNPVRQAIMEGLPVFGTCAGLIMLDGTHLGTMDIVAKRNAYGRQLGSFCTTAPFRGLEADPAVEVRLPMTFIRAPYIESVGPDVEILAVVDGRMVAARQANQLVTAFHPELDHDLRIHQFFVSMCH